MKFYLYITLILAFQLSFAKKYCKLEPINDNRVSNRSFQITFPDDRVIYLVGHAHSLKSEAELMEFASDTDFNTLSDDDYLNYFKNQLIETNRNVNSFSRKNIDNFIFKTKDKHNLDISPYIDPRDGYSSIPIQKIIDYAKKDLDFLSDFVSDKNDIFLASERKEFFKDKESQNIYKLSLRVNLLILKSEYEKRKSKIENELSWQDIENLFLSQMRVVDYFYFLNNFNRSITVIGSEESEKQNPFNPNSSRLPYFVFQDFVSLLGEWVMKLDEKQRQTFLTNKKMIIIPLLSMFTEMSTNGSFSTEENYLKLKNAIIENSSILNEEFKVLLDKILLSTDTQFYYLNFRNKIIAENLVKKKKTGIQFFGLSHLLNTASLLKEHCEIELKTKN